MQLKSILDKYDVIEAQVLYNKAVELLQLISDEELEEIFTKYPALFSKITNVHLTHEQMAELIKTERRRALEIKVYGEDN